MVEIKNSNLSFFLVIIFLPSFLLAYFNVSSKFMQLSPSNDSAGFQQDFAAD